MAMTHPCYPIPGLLIHRYQEVFQICKTSKKKSKTTIIAYKRLMKAVIVLSNPETQQLNQRCKQSTGGYSTTKSMR